MIYLQRSALIQQKTSHPRSHSYIFDITHIAFDCNIKISYINNIIKTNVLFDGLRTHSGTEVSNDVRPHEATEEHADDTDDVLLFPLRREVAITDGGDRHYAPMQRP